MKYGRLYASGLRIYTITNEPAGIPMKFIEHSLSLLGRQRRRARQRQRRERQQEKEKDMFVRMGTEQGP